MSTTLPTPAPPTGGKFTLQVAGQSHTLRLGLRVLHAYAKEQGRSAVAVGLLLADDALTTTAGLLAVAVRQQVPGQADFTLDAAFDLLEQLSPAEAEPLVAALFWAADPRHIPVVNGIVRHLQHVAEQAAADASAVPAAA